MAAVPSPVDVGERTTPQLFGMFFNYGLMGALIVQVYQYYCAFPRDSKTTKAVVYALFLLELAQTALMSYYAYQIFGAGYGNLAVLNDPSLPWFSAAVLPSVTAAIVQTFFAYRIYSSSGSKLAGGIITLLALLQCGSGVAQGVILKLHGHGHDLTWRPPFTIAGLVTAALSNLAIASCMTYFIRKETTISRNLLSVAVRYTIETGALIAVLALCQIVIHFAFPTQDYFETGVWTISKLYSNTLLALLNTRAMTIGGRDHRQSLARPQTAVTEVDFPPGDSWLSATRDTGLHSSTVHTTQGAESEGTNDKQPQLDSDNLPVESTQSENLAV